MSAIISTNHQPEGEGLHDNQTDCPARPDHLACGRAAPFGTAFAADDDVTGHWSEPYFRSLSAHGVINANGRGQFTPSAEISRAEFMRYINRAFGFTETADISQYTDVGEDQWYYESVCIAVKYGYISGLSDTEMAPNTSITREQAVTILGRLCKAEVGSVTPSQLSFSDKSSVAAWSAPYIQWAVENNYVSGYTDGTFQPKRGVTPPPRPPRSCISLLAASWTSRARSTTARRSTRIPRT